MFSEYFSLSGAGVAQLFILGDRSVSEGIPFVKYPFGDAKDDALDVQAGHRGVCG